MSRSIIVHGPQGCGKTRNADVLMRHFGCERVLDEVQFRSPNWLKREATRMPTLFLAQEPPRFARVPADVFRHVSVMPYDQAARVAGIVTPINQSDEE